MERFDKILFGFVTGLIFPVMIGMLSFIIWFYADRQEPHVIFYALIGLSIGLLIDLIFLKRWINRRYVLPVWFVAGIYIIYNICVYGFFMGFPVFNVLLGLLAGYYSGNRMYLNRIPSEKWPKLINIVSLFTGLIMTLICISSGFMALSGKGAGGEIKGMLGLNFDITKSMVYGITLIGGLSLILIQILLTRKTMIKIIKINTRKQAIIEQ